MKSISTALRPRPLSEVPFADGASAHPWFVKPPLRVFRSRALVRVRRSLLRSVLAGS